MPSRQTVDAFIALVEQGHFIEAIEGYYDPEATMQENQEPPRGPREALIAGERQIMAAFKIRTRPVERVAIDGDLVLINTFTVAPDDQERLIALLAQITRESVVTAPGFLSATLHRSLDACKVTMYARWRSAQDYAAMRQGGQSRDALDAISTIATFEPGMYEIVEEFRPGVGS